MNRHFFSLRPGRRGMVLFELLTALTIFILVAFSLVMALDAAFDAAGERNEIDAALRGLKDQMALIRAGPLVLQDKDLADDHSGLIYHLTIEPEQLQNQKKQPLNGMFRATITVKWKSGGQEENRSITELIYQP